MPRFTIRNLLAVCALALLAAVAGQAVPWRYSTLNLNGRQRVSEFGPSDEDLDRETAHGRLWLVSESKRMQGAGLRRLTMRLEAVP